MTIAWAIAHFGYAAVVVGTFFEGEIILILAGFTAHRGYLNLPLVMIAAYVGTLLGDQLYFYIGRRRGSAFLEKHANWKDRVTRFRTLMDRHDTLVLILFRFLYGLRTVAPFAIGLSGISTRKFVIFNCLSAAIWTVLIGALGYLFGHAMELVIDEIKRYEILVMLGLLAIAALAYLVRRFISKKNAE
ncbi:MAG: DedA family protein [Spirochaetes bacterium]|nr:DedA family protein [Spirochaetota bacterium]